MRTMGPVYSSERRTNEYAATAIERDAVDNISRAYAVARIPRSVSFQVTTPCWSETIFAQASKRKSGV